MGNICYGCMVPFRSVRQAWADAWEKRAQCARDTFDDKTLFTYTEANCEKITHVAQSIWSYNTVTWDCTRPLTVTSKVTVTSLECVMDVWTGVCIWVGGPIILVLLVLGGLWYAVWFARVNLYFST